MNQSLSARNIVKHYGGVVALADGNLDVRSREIVALIGANGSGKSTLSKVINGVVVLDGGQLLLGDKSVEFSSPQAAYEDFNNLPTDITDKKSDSNLFQGEIGEVIEVEGGNEVLQIESGVVRDIILGPGEWQDYSAEFDFMVLQPPQDYQDSELNIFLRTNKDNWIYPMEMYEVNLSNTFSEFKIAYRKWRSEEDKTIDDLVRIRGFRPELNAWYHIRVEIAGNNIRLYLDDNLKLSGYDPKTRLDLGYVWIQFHQFGDVIVDNIRVEEIQ